MSQYFVEWQLRKQLKCMPAMNSNSSRTLDALLSLQVRTRKQTHRRTVSFRHIESQGQNSLQTRIRNNYTLLFLNSQYNSVDMMNAVCEL